MRYTTRFAALVLATVVGLIFFVSVLTTSSTTTKATQNYPAALASAVLDCIEWPGKTNDRAQVLKEAIFKKVLSLSREELVHLSNTPPIEKHKNQDGQLVLRVPCPSERFVEKRVVILFDEDIATSPVVRAYPFARMR